MQTATHVTVPFIPELDRCRDLARQAAVNCTYHVVWNPDQLSSADETAETLEEAAALLLVSQGCTLKVDFDWSCENQQGHDWVNFAVTNPASTQHFVERTVDHLVTKRIADSMYRGLLWQNEYEGPIEIVVE